MEYRIDNLPKGTALRKFAEEEQIGDVITEAEAWEAYSLYRSLGNHGDQVAAYMAAAKRSHENGIDPLRDMGMNVAALLLSPTQYEAFMKYVKDLGPVKKVRRRTRRS